MYSLKEAPWESIWKDRSYADLLRPTLPTILFPEKRSKVRPQGLQGRGKIERITLSSDQIFKVRIYQRGGWMRHLQRSRFWGWNRRPFREFEVSLLAYQKGVPTPEPIGAVIRKRRFGFYEGAWISREIPEAQNLYQLLRAKPQGVKRKKALEAAAIGIQKMHSVGICHADLHLGNILIQEKGGGVVAYLIDFDKSRLQDPLRWEDRRRDLVRLYRSAYKYREAGGEIERTDWALFWKAYGLKEAEMREVERIGEKSVRRHAFSWNLQRGIDSR